jgi:transmembrane sensor
MDQKIEGAFKASDLIVKHIQGILTHKEQQELDNWVEQSEENRTLFYELSNPLQLNLMLEEFYRIDEGTKAAQERVEKRLSERRKVYGIIPVRMVRYVAAAAIAGALILGIYIYNKRQNATVPASEIAKTEADIKPGDGNQVILTLADGRQIPLDSIGNGLLAQQGNTEILKQKDGQIIYQADETGQGIVSNNTIQTPKGKQHELILPDGSRVWLNALSKLDFPSAFTGKDRKVSLSGEAYFDIVTDKLKPFHVNVDGIDVKVTGTEFNINSYKNEAVVKSTLFEGGVKITKDEISFDLPPGMQLQLDPNVKLDPGSKQFKLVKADLEATAAWRNGVFYLDNTDVATLMREAARWYDIEVEYPNGMPHVQLFGEIDRNTNLSELMKVLEVNGIKSRLQGKTLIIFP